MKKEDLSRAISLRISRKDQEALERLLGFLPLKKLTIARLALRIGLESLRKNPGQVIRK